MTARTVKELIQLYWDTCKKQGRKPQRVHGLVAMKAVDSHPAGDLVGWGVSRKYVEMLLERRGDAANWEIQEFEPNAQ